jgi:holliday junction DNA helicase RuvA
MLSYLKGQILTHTKDGAILKVGEVGYEVIGAWLGRSPVGTTLELYTYQYIENDSIPRLIAVASPLAREFLIELLTVQGVGPKMASRILDSADIAKLKTAITQGDVTTLKSVKGLGLKTAQKIVLELGKKLVSAENVSNTAVYQALHELGFTKSEIDQAVSKTDLTDKSENESISLVLKSLGSSR